MVTENLSTLKIHKLTQEQYDRELEAGRIDPSALYLTPDEDNSNIYVQNEEPIDAEDGALWVDLDADGESSRPLKNLVVFGDSVGAGYANNNYSFVDVLQESGAFESVKKRCVSGSTIGPYQTISGASGYSLIEQIERYSTDISNADIVIMEYGGNDVTAVIAGNVQMGTSSDNVNATTVCGYTRKAITRIRELNPHAELHWLCYTPTDFDAIVAAGKTEAEADSYILFAATALELAHNFGCNVLYHNWAVTGNFMAADGIHPNTEGHERIAEMILQNLYTDHYAKPAYRNVIADLSSQKVNGSFSNLYQLAMSGVEFRARVNFYGVYINAECRALKDNDFIEFVLTTRMDDKNLNCTSAKLYKDETLKISSITIKPYSRNLLDNSYFVKPVNQRAVSGTISATGYFLDRWKLVSGSVTINSGSITLNGKIEQVLEVSAGKATAACDGGASATYNDSTKTFSITGSKATITWAALYKGEYTADTVPEYQPKGYGAELAECQRYYYQIKANWKWIASGICTSATQAFIPIKLPQAMRINPTVTIPNPSLIKIRCGSVGSQVPSAVVWNVASDLFDIIQMESTVSGASSGDVAVLYFDKSGVIQFSADL